MERIEVYLTPQQHKKFLHHQPFQLSAPQLKASDKHIGKKFHVELQLTKAHYKKLLRNVKAGKGYRFTKEAIMGGSILGELFNGAKSVVGKIGNAVDKLGEYVSPDLIRQGVKSGLTAGATALGSLVGNPELGLMAAPLIDKGVNYAESGYNYLKGKNDHKEVLQDAYDRYGSQARQYVEDKVPAARRARELYDEYAPVARKVYRKARRVYYQEPDDEENDDNEEPPPPRRKRAPKPYSSPPAPSDYSGYGGRGLKLKKGSPEAKAWGARMQAMRQKKGGEILSIPVKNSVKNVAALGKGLKGRSRKIKGGWNLFSADDWNDLGNRIVSGTTDVGNKIASGATDVGNKIVSGSTDVGNTISSGATDAANRAVDVANKIGDDLRGQADKIVSFYQQAASTASPIVNAAIDEVSKSLPSEADAKAFGKQIASALIHQGIPQATAALCGAAAEALFPEGGPVAGAMGSQLGKMLGEKLADKIGDETGYGLRRRRGHRVLLRGGTLHKGVPYPDITPETEGRIMTHGLAFRHKGENGLFKGGSFGALGGAY